MFETILNTRLYKAENSRKSVNHLLQFFWQNWGTLNILILDMLHFHDILYDIKTRLTICRHGFKTSIFKCRHQQPTKVFCNKRCCHRIENLISIKCTGVWRIERVLHTPVQCLLNSLNFVSVCDHISSIQVIQTGLPQVSALRLLFFLLYISDPISTVKFLGILIDEHLLWTKQLNWVNSKLHTPSNWIS